jgi:hypothetical protein
MGNQASRRTEEQISQRSIMADNLVHSKKEMLDNLKTNIEAEITKHSTSKSIIPIDLKKSALAIQNSISQLIDIAKHQLDRKGKNLIKADLIAIILYIRPEFSNRIDELQSSFTVEDLNLLIRSIIYDPNTFEQKIQMSNALLDSSNKKQIENSPEIKLIQ